MLPQKIRENLIVFIHCQQTDDRLVQVCHLQRALLPGGRGQRLARGHAGRESPRSGSKVLDMSLSVAHRFLLKIRFMFLLPFVDKYWESGWVRVHW